MNEENIYNTILLLVVLIASIYSLIEIEAKTLKVVLVGFALAAIAHLSGKLGLISEAVTTPTIWALLVTSATHILIFIDEWYQLKKN